MRSHQRTHFPPAIHEIRPDKLCRLGGRPF